VSGQCGGLAEQGAVDRAGAQTVDARGVAGLAHHARALPELSLEVVDQRLHTCGIELRADGWGERQGEHAPASVTLAVRLYSGFTVA
jgi:hypothetical protein